MYFSTLQVIDNKYFYVTMINVSFKFPCMNFARICIKCICHKYRWLASLYKRPGRKHANEDFLVLPTPLLSFILPLPLLNKMFLYLSQYLLLLLLTFPLLLPPSLSISFAILILGTLTSITFQVLGNFFCFSKSRYSTTSHLIPSCHNSTLLLIIIMLTFLLILYHLPPVLQSHSPHSSPSTSQTAIHNSSLNSALIPLTTGFLSSDTYTSFIWSNGPSFPPFVNPYLNQFTHPFTHCSGIIA